MHANGILHLQDALEQLRAMTDSLKARRTLREANMAQTRPGEDALKKLDSSMKRNTALIRKLKQLGEDSRKSVLDDVAKTNQSKVNINCALVARCRYVVPLSLKFAHRRPPPAHLIAVRQRSRGCGDRGAP